MRTLGPEAASLAGPSRCGRLRMGLGLAALVKRIACVGGHDRTLPGCARPSLLVFPSSRRPVTAQRRAATANPRRIANEHILPPGPRTHRQQATLSAAAKPRSVANF